MRVAYIAPYQGPGLLKCRPTLKNLGLAANVKIELISELLRQSGHDIEILSQGEVVERRMRFYPGFAESKPSCDDVAVFYASAFPMRFVNGIWSTVQTLRLFKTRHRTRPYDLVIVYNLKRPQVVCARHAINALGLPTILEFEDDAFVDVTGLNERGAARLYLAEAKRTVASVHAGIGVSPHLLARFPTSIPKLLLRGVVHKDILAASRRPMESRDKWVVFSGAHYRSKGLEQLIEGWVMAGIPEWELHIAGRGDLTDKLMGMAGTTRSIVFHGVLSRQENARLLSRARIGINPHEVSLTPGNVFAFKIIEYLAAGLHCVTTPMGPLEAKLEAGITYMQDNAPGTIARTLIEAIALGSYERVAADAAQESYGPETVARALGDLVKDAMKTRNGRGG